MHAFCGLLVDRTTPQGFKSGIDRSLTHSIDSIINKLDIRVMRKKDSELLVLRSEYLVCRISCAINDLDILHKHPHAEARCTVILVKAIQAKPLNRSDTAPVNRVSGVSNPDPTYLVKSERCQRIEALQ